jgi:tetratricopeptide (TPR) repeat protein
MHRRYRLGFLLAVVALAGAVALWWRPRPQPPATAAAGLDLEPDAPPAPDPGYLGPQACVACHAQRVAEFQATRHFRACRRPQPETMPPGFAPGRGTYATRDPALRFEMTQAGGEFFQTAVHITAAGEQRTPARIAFAYGSGGAGDEIYFTWHGDRLFELPVAWLHPLKQWGEQPFNPYGTGDYSRPTTSCLECHNTWFEHVAGTENQYRRGHFILGVTCERCHGPGREHVAFHQAHAEADSGQAIVHPRRLTRDRQLDVCGQCHSNAMKPRGPALSYRQGEPLEAYFRTARVEHQENDHVADQVKYLRQSRCFQMSDTLTCTTCHNPHRPASPGSVARACLKCHQPANCTEHDRLPAAVRGDCVGCHMPRYNRVEVHFDTEDDQYVAPMRPHQHRIAVYPAARQEVLRAWHRAQPDTASRREADRLTELLVAHWLSEAEKQRQAYRFLAAIGALREAVRLDPTPAKRDRLHQAVAVRAKLDTGLYAALHLSDEQRFPEAIDALNELLTIKPDWARVHGKLGTLYAVTGQRERAVEHLQAVARYDPDDAYGESMLGWLAYLEDRAEDAVEALRQADDIEPYNAKINYHWGLALAKFGRWEEAGECFRRVLTIDPDHAGGCQGLSHALRQRLAGGGAALRRACGPTHPLPEPRRPAHPRRRLRRGRSARGRR